MGPVKIPSKVIRGPVGYNKAIGFYTEKSCHSYLAITNKERA